jgi:hypothetical protein
MIDENQSRKKDFEWCLAKHNVLTDLSWEQGSSPGDIVCLDDTVRLPWLGCDTKNVNVSVLSIS